MISKLLIIAVIFMYVLGSKIRKAYEDNTFIDNNIEKFVMTLDENFQQEILNKFKRKKGIINNKRCFRNSDLNIILDEISDHYYYNKEIKSHAEALKKLNVHRKKGYKYYPLVKSEKKIIIW